MRCAAILALPVLLSAVQLHAQDGGQLFTLYCSACHGNDGKGATGGMFPPLAGSEWVAGDPARSVKIVLHGLHGPVDVDGKTYNLDMPPQGGILQDDQIASILSYVRSSWGNKEEPVTADLVKATREATSGRKNAWTAEELLKLHPLPKSPPPIANLLSQVYQGTWQTLPDFTVLQAGNIEEEHEGKISLKKSGLDDHYGMVWQGDLTAPDTGEFTFRLDADDGARILIDGHEVVRVDGTGPLDGSRMQEGKIALTAGSHKLRVEYFEFEGVQGIAIAWKGPGIPAWRNLTDMSPQSPHEPIVIGPRDGRAAIYRNFIKGTTPRAIGVGFPGGVNLAYSADHLGPELLWTGAFMDGSRHWRDRGQGDQPPAGKRLVKISGSPALREEARFKGYRLDAAGNPTFSVMIGKQYLIETWKPVGTEAAPALARTLLLKGHGSPIEVLLAEDAATFSNELAMETGDAAVETKGNRTVVTLQPGKTVVVDYRWK